MNKYISCSSTYNMLIRILPHRVRFILKYSRELFIYSTIWSTIIHHVNCRFVLYDFVVALSGGIHDPIQFSVSLISFEICLRNAKTNEEVDSNKISLCRSAWHRYLTTTIMRRKGVVIYLMFCNIVELYKFLATLQIYLDLTGHFNLEQRYFVTWKV